jgi:hypothetical protein
MKVCGMEWINPLTPQLYLAFLFVISALTIAITTLEDKKLKKRKTKWTNVLKRRQV